MMGEHTFGVSSSYDIIFYMNFWDVNLINRLKEILNVPREVIWDQPLTFTNKRRKRFKLIKDKLRKFPCNWFRI